MKCLFTTTSLASLTLALTLATSYTSAAPLSATSINNDPAKSNLNTSNAQRTLSPAINNTALENNAYANIGSDYSTDPSLFSDEYYGGSTTTSSGKDISAKAAPAKRPVLPVLAFTDSLSSARGVIRPYHNNFPQNYFIPDGTGPLRWSCVFNKNNVAVTPLGTHITITRSNGHSIPAPPKSHRPPHPGRPYSCGEMVARNRGVGYGKYSIDMISTDVKGHVTALFLITHGPTPNGEGSEIDIELTGLDPTVVWLNIWKGAVQQPVKMQLGFDASKGWHNYAVEWQPGFIAWSIDGKEVLRKTDVETIDPRTPGVEYRLTMNSWTHDQEDHWAGRFEWPANRRSVMGQFRNLKFTPAVLR